MNTLLENAQAIIFDVDGLLIDSEGLWQLTRDEFLGKRNIVYDQSIDSKVIGRGIKDIMLFWHEYFGLEGDVDELTSEYRSLFYIIALDSKKLTLMPGAQELIDALFQKKKQLAIATGGHSKEKMLQILDVFDLGKFFPIVVSSDEVKKGKPAPDVFLLTVEKLAVEKSNCVILEDALNGIMAAKAAGIAVIGVQKDAVVAKRLEEEGANLVIKSLEELL